MDNAFGRASASFQFLSLLGLNYDQLSQNGTLYILIHYVEQLYDTKYDVFCEFEKKLFPNADEEIESLRAKVMALEETLQDMELRIANMPLVGTTYEATKNDFAQLQKHN